MRLAAFLLLICFSLGAPAFGQQAPLVGIRVGNHPTYGRVVLDWPNPVTYRAEEAGDRLVLRFEAPARFDLSAALRLPKNVLSISAIESGVALQAPPGTRFRHYRLGNRVVIDVLDGNEAAPSAAEAAAGPAAAPPPPRRAAVPLPLPPTPIAEPPRGAAPVPAAAGVAPSESAAPPDAASQASPIAAASPGGAETPSPPPAAPAPAPAPAQAPGPAVVAPPQAPLHEAAQAPAVVPSARNIPVTLAADGRAISLTLGENVGAAVFRNGDWIMVVFDQPEALDLAALRRSEIFRAMETREGNDSTTLQMRLAQPSTLRPRRNGNTWVLEAFRDAVEANRSLTAIVPEVDQGPPARLVLRTARPGRSVSVLDPETGSPLLVGTLREPGHAVAIARRQPEFQLLPAMLGVAVLPRGDNMQLRALNDRFVLQAARLDSLRLGEDAGREPLAEAATLSRIMDLPTASVAALQERLRAANANIAAAGPLGRTVHRRHAAEALLALGMPQEAQAMASTALQEDPQAGADMRLLMVQAAAALLSGRQAEARQMENPQIPETDETTLWRGFLAAARGDHAVAGPAIASALPLLISYPRPLARRLAPIAMESLASAGELGAAARLGEADPDNPVLHLARGMVAEADGRVEEALIAYERAKHGRDRLRRARAIRRSVELRLATGRLDTAGAISELQAALFAWRGDDEEVSARVRLAELQRQAGDGRAAFELLQETQRFYTERAAELRGPLRAAFAVALETAPPLNAASFYDAHPEFMPEDEASARSVLMLADRLVALDLLDRASALLGNVLTRATDPAIRRLVSTKLAMLRFADGDASGALAALDAAPGDVEEPDRVILRAKLLARTGNRSRAESLLSGLGNSGAEALAEIRAEAQDWPGASQAMLRHIRAATPPPPEPLNPAQRRDLARAGAFAAMANDTDALAHLRETYGARMAGGPLAEAFVLLTSDSARGVQDLPRLQREISQLRLLPERLGGLNAAAPPVR